MTKYSSSKVFFKEKIYDFGEIKNFEVVNHLFEYKNIGIEDLKILKIRPSCGCIKVNHKNKIIKPNESGNIIINFTPVDYGYFNKGIEIKTNSKHTLIIYISIKGFVIK
ncbi:MAG: DUF1573 domain-containing protein [Hyphomicrobiales bacterium]